MPRILRLAVVALVLVLVLTGSVKAAPFAVTVQDAIFDLAARRVALPEGTSLTVTNCTVRGAGVLAVNLTAMIEAAIRNDTAPDSTLKIEVLIHNTSFWSLSQLHLELPAQSVSELRPRLPKPLQMNIEIRNCTFTNSVAFAQDIGALATVGVAASNGFQLVIRDCRWYVDSEVTLVAQLPATNRALGQTFAAGIVLGDVSGCRSPHL